MAGHKPWSEIEHKATPEQLEQARHDQRIAEEAFDPDWARGGLRSASPSFRMWLKHPVRSFKLRLFGWKSLD